MVSLVFRIKGRAVIRKSWQIESENRMILTFLVGLGLLILVLVSLARRQGELFNKQFPPISDAEFIARCTPGVNPTVALRVRRIVANNLGVEYERIYPSTRFVEDLGAD